MTKPAAFAIIGLALLAACGMPRVDDPRAQAIIALPGPQHYATREVARELAGRCAAYVYDQELAEAMSRERVKAGLVTSLQVRSASKLEADLLRRTYAARYGADWPYLDPCTVLEAESASGTPLSVLVRRRG